MLAAAAPNPGPHTAVLPLSVSLRRGADATFHGGFHASECYPVSTSNLEPKFVVGWGEYEWFGSPCSADVYQVAVSFDKGELAQAPDGTSIDRVMLGYDEVEMPVPSAMAWYPAWASRTRTSAPIAGAVEVANPSQNPTAAWCCVCPQPNGGTTSFRTD